MKKKLQPGIYVHLPFCSVHCIYCDFPISTRSSLSDRYYRALLSELHAKPPKEEADTLYFGGGTPSLAPMDVLREILERVLLQRNAEITLEVNPDHVTAEKLAGWRAAGINRLSLGIQSLEQEVLRMMLRQHSPQEAVAGLKLARDAGFENISVDLILGFPKQTPAPFLSGLKELIELEPDHLSIYLLELHEGTGLQKLVQSGRAHVMKDEEQVRCFEEAIDLLEAGGYRHYEVSNFARPDKVSLHNLKYWTDAPYYGYGAGACSSLTGVRTRNISDVAAYIRAIEHGSECLEETIREDQETIVRNAVIFGLRRVEGIDLAGFESRYGRNPLLLFGDDLEKYVEQNLLEIVDSRLRLTRRGLFLSNEVLSSAIG